MRANCLVVLKRGGGDPKTKAAWVSDKSDLDVDIGPEKRRLHGISV